MLNLVIDSAGRVESSAVESGGAPFAAAALAASQRWLFQPAMVNQTPVAARIRFVAMFAPPPVAEAPNAPTEPAAPETPPLEAFASSQPEKNSEGVAARAEAKPLEVLVATEVGSSSQALSRQEVKTLPGAFGDPFRAVDVLPSMVPVASGLPYYFVRGAPPGNVGYYLDDIEMPLLYHFAAGPAVVHPALLGSVELLAGAAPPRWGGKTGGFVVGNLADLEHQSHGEASIRLLDAAGIVETPFHSGRGSVALAGRYSYAAWLLSQLLPDTSISYWDYQARANYAVGRSDTLQLVALSSSDSLTLESETPPGAPGGGVGMPPTTQPTGNRGVAQSQSTALEFHRLDLRWLHALEDGTLRVALGGGADFVKHASGAVEGRSLSLQARSRVTRALSKSIDLDIGGIISAKRIRQRIDPEFFAEPEPPMLTNSIAGGPAAGPNMVEPPAAQPGDSDYDLQFGNRVDAEVSGNAELNLQVAPRLSFSPGLRATVFSSGTRTETAVEPRAQARFQVLPRIALIHGFGLIYQRPSFPIPLPSTEPTLRGGLQRAAQYFFSISTEPADNNRLVLTFYQNIFSNFVDLLGVPRGETDGFRTAGRSYGAELLWRRRLTHSWGALISYNLSRSERSRGRFHGPASTDRRHVVNAALSWQPWVNWLFGVRALAYSGVPARVAEVESRKRPRTRPFWRLDWRAQKTWRYSRGSSLSLVLEVLNTTLNEEVFSLDCTFNAGTRCVEDRIGPITIPNIGVEATF